jgi:uncharacterized protein
MKKLVLPLMVLICPIAHAEYCYKDEMTLPQLTQCANKGDAVAQNMLGDMHYAGLGVPQDYKVAFRLFSDAAAQGYAPAQYNIMLMYGIPKGFQQDYKKAVAELMKSAEQGYAPAQNMLGEMYFKGIDKLGKGISQNYMLAYMWVNLSAAQNNADAIKNKKIFSKVMTPDQISRAETMSVEHMKKDIKK